MISCDFYHDVILLLTPITNISESYYLEIEKKIRTVDFDVIKMSWSISTATPLTDIKLHHLVWALSIRYLLHIMGGYQCDKAVNKNDSREVI